MVSSSGHVLTFVPFETKRAVAIGQGTRRVTMKRSPSPVLNITRHSTSLGTGVTPARPLSPTSPARPLRPLPSPSSASASTSTSTLTPAPTSTSASVSANGHGLKANGVNGTAPRRVMLNPTSPKASVSEGSATAGSSVRPLSHSAQSTPSRKGKEKEQTPVHVNGKANGTLVDAPNGSMSPLVKMTPNGTPHGTPKAKGRDVNGAAHVANGTPRANGNGVHAKEGRGDEGHSSTADVDLAWPHLFADARRAAGLHNGSMACYSNATLQVLLHTPPVLGVAVDHKPGNCLLKSRNKFCMLCAIREIAGEHWSGKKRAYRPNPVHAHLGQIKKGFSRNRQEDAHEFFRFVTDAFQNTALAGKPKDLPEKIKRATWVYRTWGGQVRSRVLCLTCKKPSDTFDSFLDLSLDVPNKARSLGDLFKVFCHEDRLDGDNKYNCENCKKKSAATKSMRIAEAPPVLTLHLKRFGYSLSWPSRMTKVNSLIEYPHNLDIAPYMTEGKQASGTEYRLFAITCHHGSALHYGHYTSYVRGPDGSWYNADDDDVSPESAKSVLHDKSAYLLSYMRVGKGSKSGGSFPTGESKAMSAPNSPSSSKRRREDESPSPQKRLIGPVRPPLSAAYGANGKAAASELSRLGKQYDSDSEDTTTDSLVQPRPRPVNKQTSGSPISRPSHPGPSSPKLKSKFHRPNHKQGIEARGPAPHGHGKKRHGNPFAAGGLRSNARYSGQARDSLKRKKNLISGMRRKGM